VTARRPRWAALRGAVYAVVAARALSAQVAGTADLGVSTVRYDGFLPAGAASLSSAFVLKRPRSTLSARGGYLVFESGNTSMHAGLAGSAFTHATGRWRGEFWATAGGSRYADFASFWHALGGVRVHFLAGRGSVWIDGSAGRTSFGRAPRPAAAVAAGLWTRRDSATLTLSTSRTRVGDTVYSDVGALARGRRGRLELEGALAARLWSRGGGRGVFGEASAVFDLSERAALVLAGGRYPTDPIRGSISGRYFTAGLRLRSLLARRPASPPAPVPVHAAGGSYSSSSDERAAAWLEIHPESDGVVRFVILAPQATSVELAGDFTDWRPVALRRVDSSRWEALLPIARGVHRINARLGRGPWIVPVGATRTADDYGGETGMFVVP